MSESKRNGNGQNSTAYALIELTNLASYYARRKRAANKRQYKAYTYGLSHPPSSKKSDFLKNEMAGGKQKLLAVLNTLMSNATCNLSFCQCAHSHGRRNDVSEQKLKTLFSWYVVSLNFFHQLTEEESQQVHGRMLNGIIRALERINIPNLSDDHAKVCSTVSHFAAPSPTPSARVTQNPTQQLSASSI